MHNFFHNLHCEKVESISAGDFNCVDTPIELEDLLKLQSDIVKDYVEGVSGFFFGDTKVYSEDQERVLQDIAKCMMHLRKGDRLYYTSWW